MAQPPLLDRWIGRARNHPLVAALLLAGMVLIGLANLTDALRNISAFVDGPDTGKEEDDVAGLPEIALHAFSERPLVEGHSYKVTNGRTAHRLDILDVKGRQQVVRGKLTAAGSGSAIFEVAVGRTTPLVVGKLQYEISVHSVQDHPDNRDVGVLSLRLR
jgi:hypothetical protein